MVRRYLPSTQKVYWRYESHLSLRYCAQTNFFVTEIAYLSLTKENSNLSHLQRRCGEMEARIVQLKDLLADRRAAVVRMKERLDSQRALVERTVQGQKAIEGDKGKLEQTYYDIYFEQVSEANHFSERIGAIRSVLSRATGPAIDEAMGLIDVLEAETRIAIPTLRPYPRLRVDLGLTKSCTDFCLAHQRSMTSRMSNAFAGTRVNAILDLSAFADAAEYLAAVHSKSKGNVTREARRATLRGLVCKLFDPKVHLADIEAILQSKPERQAGALRPPYNQGAEAFLKYVGLNHPNHIPPCPHHHNTWHGIFEPGEGGNLLGFIMVERHGQFGHYRHIMGHGDWLAQGIMFHLHFAVVEWIYASQPGLSLVSYAQWTDLPDAIDTRPGLTRWKKKALFKPIRLIETLQGKPEDMRSNIIEMSRNKAFPHYVLDHAQSAACLYSAALMGQRDVIHVANRGIETVTLVDHDAEMMDEMRKAYPERWSYHVGDAFDFIRRSRASCELFDVVILDPWVYLEQANVTLTKQLVGIATQYVLISLTDIHFFRPNHLKPVSEDAFRYFHALDETIVSVDLALSTRSFGGLYWCVLKLPGAMPSGEAD